MAGKLSENFNSFLPLDIRQYADQIRSVAGKLIVSNDIVFISPEDLYSTCFFAVGTGGLIAPQTLPIFSVPFDTAGQGSTVALTLSETNLSGNPFSGNEMYVAKEIGFALYMATSTTNLTPIVGVANVAAAAATLPLTGPDMQGLSSLMAWQYTMGAGPTRTRGLVKNYPHGAGVYAGGAASITSGTLYESVPQLGGPNCPPRMFDGDAIIFAPTIKNLLSVVMERAFTIFNSTTTQLVAVRATMRGHRFTFPVGM